MKHFKNLILLSLFSVAMSCSSSPSTDSAAVSVPIDDRTAYIQYADKKISHWDAEAAKLREPQRIKLQNNIADARIELQELQSSTNSNWTSYRNRLEGAFDRIETSFNQPTRQ